MRALRLCALVRSEECGCGIPQTHTKHTASPSAPRQPAPVMLNNRGSPHDHSLERGSGWAGPTPYCWLRERKDDRAQTSEEDSGKRMGHVQWRRLAKVASDRKLVCREGDNLGGLVDCRSS